MSARRRCRVTSADIPGLLRTLSAANVSLSDIETDGRLTVSFTVPVLSAGLVGKLCEKRGEQVRFSRYGGFAFALWDLRKRPVFLLTVFLLLGLTWAAAQPGAVCGGGGQFPHREPGHSGAGSPMRHRLLGLPVGGPQRKNEKRTSGSPAGIAVGRGEYPWLRGGHFRPGAAGGSPGRPARDRIRRDGGPGRDH